MELPVNREGNMKEKKKEEPEPHKVLVTIASLSISRKLARQELRSKGS